MVEFGVAKSVSSLSEVIRGRAGVRLAGRGRKRGIIIINVIVVPVGRRHVGTAINTWVREGRHRRIGEGGEAS
jgi:hypothetical protein